MLDQNTSIIFWTYWTWKTYYAVRNAFEAWKNWSIIISNMWLAIPHIRWYLPSDLPPIMHELYDYHYNNITPFDAPDSFLFSRELTRKLEQPRSFYILIDEASVFFNSRNFQNNFKDKSLLVMLAEPRHFNMQVTAIAQELDLIDKTFRDLAQEIIEFTTTWFWLCRKAISYDKNRMFDAMWGIRPDSDAIIDTKTYFHYLNKKKDQNKYFWGLYYTKEVLWDIAIKHNSDILSLKDYLQKEDQLIDWQFNLLNKSKDILTSSTKNIKSSYTFLNKKIWDLSQKNITEK